MAFLAQYSLSRDTGNTLWKKMVAPPHSTCCPQRLAIDNLVSPWTYSAISLIYWCCSAMQSCNKHCGVLPSAKHYTCYWRYEGIRQPCTKEAHIVRVKSSGLSVLNSGLHFPEAFRQIAPAIDMLSIRGILLEAWVFWKGSPLPEGAIPEEVGKYVQNNDCLSKICRSLKTGLTSAGVKGPGTKI